MSAGIDTHGEKDTAGVTSRRFARDGERDKRSKLTEMIYSVTGVYIGNVPSMRVA